ncbi:DUF6998 domain-containing protein [Aquimarina algiphila]|uniref:DUF6998 domain-containing protein n=1 Tax=Aquimarina algiphila TaxID=2047982 RepID=UPI00233126CB|nr:hypothetical protein [Aquimarina algiphila]
MKEIKQLLEITHRLRSQYKRSFPLDGRLVGDIGEVLAKEKYGIELYSENSPIHDGFEIATGRKVQIKATFKNYCYFPFGKEKIPDYFLSINILENGQLEELFNGPGQFVYDNYIIARNLKPYKKTFYTLSKGPLKKLGEAVPSNLKIQKIQFK